MPETITTTITTGITLNSTNNPLTITSTGAVSVSSSTAAIYGFGGDEVFNSGAVTGGFGIFFAGTGFVSNASTGVVTADGGMGATGIGMKGAGTVLNAGIISSTDYGVALVSGGYVSNASHGMIEGGTATVKPGVSLGGMGVYIDGSSGVVVNNGTISGNYGVILNSTTGNVTNAGLIEGKYGVKITDGLVYNKPTGTIMASGGVAVIDDGGGVANFGLIESTGGTGVFLGNGGTLFNLDGATISGTGNYSVFVKGGGTIVDAGTITNPHGVAIVFSGGGNNRLVLDPTADLHGVVGVVGGGSGSNVLELAAGTSFGYIQSLHTFYGFNNITLDNGAYWDIGGTITNTDTLTMDGKLGTLTFLGLLAPNEDAGTISGFQSGDAIGLYNELATGETFANGFLTLTGTGPNETLAFAGDFTTRDFTLTNISGSTEITTDIPCFCAGTRILTTFGQKLVEDILPGDELVTCLPGGPTSRKVVWTGSRRLKIAQHAAPALIRPIRIRAGAIAPGVPERDLRLSPHHAVYLDGCLFEAQALINNDTIFQEQNTESVTYHHIEVDAHSIILANGLPTETFLDTGNRYMFDNNAVTTLHPDFRPKGDADFCAPLIREGEALTAARLKLTKRRRQQTAL